MLIPTMLRCEWSLNFLFIDSPSSTALKFQAALSIGPQKSSHGYIGFFPRKECCCFGSQEPANSLSVQKVLLGDEVLGRGASINVLPAAAPARNLQAW